MELTKTKYKQTEIGLIPEDWEVKRLRQIANFFNGKAHEQSISEHGDYFVVNSKFISTEGKIFKNSKENICPLEKGTIVMVMSDIPNGKALAKCFMIPEDDKYTLNQRICAIKSDIVDNEFLIRKLNRNDFYLAFDSGTGQTNLKKEDVLNCPVAYPAIRSEQKAIAQVLSDTDTLIQTLEQKLVKKRAIKQGAMQQLLTPKEDWEVRKLSNVCWFQEGPGLRNWQFTKKGMKVINVTNFVKGYLNLDKTDRHISLNEFETMYKHFEIDENDIVMASSGNSYSKVAVVRKEDLPLLMNTSVIRFKPLKEIDYNFLLIFLKSKSFKTQIDLLITGGAQPNFGPFHLNRIDIDLPSTIDEQRQISNILTDMEFEIEQLEQKLDKYKLLKQGLMQELLTGRIRLV